MSADQTSLASLHDIVVPASAPWWPPAPGWYWIMGSLALLAAVLLWRTLAHWQRNRYRREALAELASIEAALHKFQADEQAPVKALPQMAELLKRTALTAYPRDQVAALTGPAWFAFLDQTGGTAFSAGLGAALARGNYETDTSGDTTGRAAEIAREIRRWIKQHAYVEVADVEGTEPAGIVPSAHLSTANTAPTGKKHSTARTP